MDSRNIVFTTHNQVEASVMQSILESNGIEVFSYGESISNMYGIYSPTIGGIELGRLLDGDAEMAPAVPEDPVVLFPAPHGLRDAER